MTMKGCHTPLLKAQLSDVLSHDTGCHDHGLERLLLKVVMYHQVETRWQPGVWEDISRILQVTMISSHILMISYVSVARNLVDPLACLISAQRIPGCRG